MNHVARNDRLHGSGDGQFHTIHGYQCIQHKLEDVFEENFFGGLWSRLREGDEIRIFEMVDDRIHRMCEAIVLERSEKKVFIVPMRPEIRFEGKLAQHDNYVGKPKSEPVPETKYAQGDGKVKWNPGSKKFDVLINGELVAKVKEKEEAEEIAYGHKPIPVEN